MAWYDDLGNYVFGGRSSAGIDPNLKNYDSATAQLGQIASGAAGRAAPTVQASQLATGNIDQSRGGLMGVAGDLGRIASGQQAGAGEIAVNRQLGQATAAQTAAARMAHGANAALASRNAARNTADLGLQGAGQAAQAQMQDQQAANAQRGALYGQAYGQDTNVAQANAQLGQQASLANQQSQLYQTQMNDARQIQAIGAQLGWDQARIAAEIAKSQAQNQDKGIFGGLLGAAGQIFAGKG